MRQVMHACILKMIREALIYSLLILAMPAGAAIYNCKDANGRQIFSEQPCGAHAKIMNVSPASGTVAIDPAISSSVEYYDVSGMTMAEMAESIRRNGPAGWSGITHSKLSYAFKIRPIPNGCKLESLKVDADLRVRLPRWVEQYKVAAQMRQQWEDSIRRLDLHERGHVKITIDAAQRIERAFRNIPAVKDCTEFDNIARVQTEVILQEYKNRQIEYDRR